MRIETLGLLRCPRCRRGSLASDGGNAGIIADGFLRCEVCAEKFPVEAGIPVFLPAALRQSSSDPSFRDLDEDTRQKVAQREWHDEAYAKYDGQYTGQYKRSGYRDRSLFAFLLYYQLREVESMLAARAYPVIANICCGEGFELEYLSLIGRPELGGQVLVADISRHSVQRALAKGERLGLAVDGICCDAENLPLRENSCDLALTHHSLHHLPNPLRGLEEMMRVSRGTIACFEPAKGPMRSLVRALGLKPAVEESGNQVYEFGGEELRQLCGEHRVRLRYLRKSLIFGPACEPPYFRRLDRLGLSRALSAAIAAANRLAGPWVGTKCAVIMDKMADKNADKNPDKDADADKDANEGERRNEIAAAAKEPAHA